MADKVQKIKEEIERLKQINGYLPVDNYDLDAAYRARGYQFACDDITQFIDSLPEELASEDLEEEIDRCWERWIDPDPEVKGVDGYLSKDEFSTYASHFAEWQKHKMKKALQTEYEKGLYDMREEMMKDAVGGEVVYQIGSAEIVPTDIRYKVVSDRVYIPNIKLGDKVKIIIVKEN